MKLAQNLRIHRLESGLTLKALEKLTGIGYSTLSKYEREITKPHNMNLKKLAEFYGVSVSELMGGVSEEEATLGKIEKHLGRIADAMEKKNESGNDWLHG